MDDLNIFTFLLDFFNVLSSLAVNIWNFINTTIHIGDYSFKPVLVLGGGVFATLLILKLVKDFVPLV